jgi:hypothetical protein
MFMLVFYFAVGRRGACPSLPGVCWWGFGCCHGGDGQEGECDMAMVAAVMTVANGDDNNDDDNNDNKDNNNNNDGGGG